jgi:hypothetical protein
MEDDHEASDTEFLLRLNSAARLADGVGPGPKNNCCWFNKRELMRFGVVWTLGSLFFLAFVGMVVLRASTLPNPVDDQQEGVFSEQRFDLSEKLACPILFECAFVFVRKTKNFFVNFFLSP